MNHVGKLACIVAAIVCLAVHSTAALADAGRTQDSASPVETWLPLSDSIRLRTIVYSFGVTNEKRPVVLLRSPYLNARITPAASILNIYGEMAKYYFDQGYFFVLQAIRGTGGSEGTYLLFNQKEIDDGYETVQWIASQPFSNGKVAIIGSSYDGFTALAAGIRNPPALKVIFPDSAPSNSFTDFISYNGVLTLELLPYLRFNDAQTGEVFESAFVPRLMSAASGSLNLLDYDNLIYGREIPEWNRLAEAYRDIRSDYWKQRQIFSRIREIAVPTYHSAGVAWDECASSAARNFIEADRNSPFRQNHHLILGNWGHGEATPMSEESLPPFLRKRRSAIMAYYLKGIETPYAREPRVSIASNLGSEFLKGDSYPTLFQKERMFYLGNTGSPVLTDRQVQGQDSSTYVYDPTSTQVTSLEYTYRVQEQLPLNGMFGVDLYVQIDVPQTDLLVYLSKTDSSGNSTGLGNRGQCFLGQRLENTSGILHVQVKSCPVIHTLQPGDTLQVNITSATFPVTARNTNEDPTNFYSQWRKANIRVLHSEQYPSRFTVTLEK